ncbi:MAG: BrnA antitoxin family protein [Moraxellaceae bacterium]|nr:BrnA antitoxin family protein [Moraxellaceae bacterium]
MSDEDIVCDDENPAMTDAAWQNAVMKVGKRAVGRPVSNNPKVSTTVRLSPEVIAYFKATGKGWQTRLDAVLREYLQTHPI